MRNPDVVYRGEESEDEKLSEPGLGCIYGIGEINKNLKNLFINWFS
jgi:hypothetical protein